MRFPDAVCVCVGPGDEAGVGGEGWGREAAGSGRLAGGSHRESQFHQPNQHDGVKCMYIHTCIHVNEIC